LCQRTWSPSAEHATLDAKDRTLQNVTDAGTLCSAPTFLGLVMAGHSGGGGGGGGSSGTPSERRLRHLSVEQRPLLPADQ